MLIEQPPQQYSGALAIGLVLGLLAVLVSVVSPSWRSNDTEGVVAKVNDTAITREKYLSYLEMLSADKKNPIKAQDSQYVLQRLVEEELLVQRGVEVGLLDSDKRTRAAMVNGMISMTTAAAEARAHSDEELTDFYQDNLAYFTPTSRLRVRQLIVQGGDAQQAAQMAYERLSNGENFQVVNSQFGSEVALTIPASALPPAKLSEYLGPAITQLLLEKPRGFVSEPMAMGGAYRIVQLLDKEAGQARPMLEVRDQVEAEYVRRAGEEALRDYLQWLKDRAEIEYPSELSQ